MRKVDENDVFKTIRNPESDSIVKFYDENSKTPFSKDDLPDDEVQFLK